MEDDTDEILGEFLVESFEALDQLDQDLVALEREPGSVEILQAIFRAFHTIKGTCGFLGFTTLEAVTHAAETMLALLRDGTATYDAEIAGVLMQTTDSVREMLGIIEQTHAEGPNDYAALVANLHHLVEMQSSDASGADDRADDDVVDDQAEDDMAEEDTAEDLARLGDILVERGVTTPTDIAIALVEQSELGDERPLGEILVESGSVSAEDVSAALADQQRARSTSGTLRVDVHLLDALVTLVGELVLTRNQIRQLTTDETVGNALVTAGQRLNSVTAELQSHVMKTRMQPIGSVWSKLPRVVRDLAVQCDKRVRVEMQGQSTELDKAVVEAIKDPLTHMVRNSVDHGIELPHERLAAGKPEEGLLTLRAFHESGNVHIEIADDGRGIDVARVKAKAIQNQLISESQAAAMSDRDAVDLVFRPGFSTADQVSNLSGRGVGMDVVRTNIESIGGTVECDNRVGRGTTFRVQIPLTLAIVPALITRCSGERFAIPHANLVELVGLSANARYAIEFVQGEPVYRLRGRMLPIVYLDQELQLRPRNAQRDSKDGTIVVVRADGREFGLVVDHVVDTEEIVVKPLPSHVESVSAFSGCTVMGDGEVALILDVRGIAQAAHVLDHSSTTAEAGQSNADAASTPAEQVLIVRINDSTQAAIAIDHVERLEVFESSMIEIAAGHRVVQYRGALLPLLDLASALGVACPRHDDGSVPVVVYADGARSVGLVIDRVVDIVSEHTKHYDVNTPGVSSATVVAGTVTDVIDVASLLAAMPASFGELVAKALELESIDA